MAETYFKMDDPLTQKMWADDLVYETKKTMAVGDLMGRDSDSMIHEKVELSKGAGDAITFGLRLQLTGHGTTEKVAMRGREEAMQFYNDALIINELNHAVNVPGKITIASQRVPYDLGVEAKKALTDWWATRMNVIVGIQGGGFTGKQYSYLGRPPFEMDEYLRSVYAANNEVLPPSQNRWLTVGGKNEEDLVKGDIFDLHVIDDMVAMAREMNPCLRPMRGLAGDAKYLLLISPVQERQLRTNTGPTQWADIQKFLNAGYQKSNAFAKNGVGVYNGVEIRVFNFLPYGVNSKDGSTVWSTRRSILFGAQAMASGYGGAVKDKRNFDFVIKDIGYNEQVGVGLKSLIGMKKTQFKDPAGVAPREDYGVIVNSTYADLRDGASSSSRPPSAAVPSNFTAAAFSMTRSEEELNQRIAEMEARKDAELSEKIAKIQNEMEHEYLRREAQDEKTIVELREEISRLEGLQSSSGAAGKTEKAGERKTKKDDE